MYIRNLATSVDDESLRRHFERCGRVVSAVVKHDLHTKRHLGYGFVEYGTVDDVEAAMMDLQGSMLEGRSIHVERSKSRPGASGITSFARSRSAAPPRSYGAPSSHRDHDPYAPAPYDPYAASSYRGGYPPAPPYSGAPVAPYPPMGYDYDYGGYPPSYSGTPPSRGPPPSMPPPAASGAPGYPSGYGYPENQGWVAPAAESPYDEYQGQQGYWDPRRPPASGYGRAPASSRRTDRRYQPY